MEDLLVVITVFGSVALVAISFSPVGRSIAERLRGRPQAELPPETLEDVDALKEQVGQLSQQVSELAERQDFAERLLTQAREKGLLAGGANK